MSFIPIYRGTILKLNVRGLYLNTVNLSDVNFTCEFYAGNNSKSIIFTKRDLVPLAENEYLAIIDTSKLDTGKLKCRSKIYMPDGDTLEEARLEIQDAEFESPLLILR